MFETSHRENRVVAVSAERLFDVVADVERYPEFVPLMQRRRSFGVASALTKPSKC